MSIPFHLIPVKKVNTDQPLAEPYSVFVNIIACSIILYFFDTM
jgi:hypothetical protein